MSKHKAVREALAAYAHDAWSGWMKHLFNRCTKAGKPASLLDRSLLINSDYVENLMRQMETPYDQLSEEEKESDRKEADRMLGVVARFEEVYAPIRFHPDRRAVAVPLAISGEWRVYVLERPTDPVVDRDTAEKTARKINQALRELYGDSSLCNACQSPRTEDEILSAEQRGDIDDCEYGGPEGESDE